MEIQQLWPSVPSPAPRSASTILEDVPSPPGPFLGRHGAGSGRQPRPRALGLGFGVPWLGPRGLACGRGGASNAKFYL